MQILGAVDCDEERILAEAKVRMVLQPHLTILIATGRKCRWRLTRRRHCKVKMPTRVVSCRVGNCLKNSQRNTATKFSSFDNSAAID